MKRNKGIILLLTIAILLSISSAFAYAWLIFDVSNDSIDVSSSSFDITLSNLEDVYNKIPGDNIWLNENGVNKIVNKGNRNAIVEISFENSITCELNKDKEPYDNLKSDYFFIKNKWYLKKERLNEVVQINMNINNWIKIGDKYYILIPYKSSADVDDIYLKILGELGGGTKIDSSNYTPERSFEQDAIFKVHYKATAIQATKDSVTDFFGSKIANSIPIMWYD